MTKRRYRAGRHWLWNAQMYATPKKHVSSIPDGTDPTDYDDVPAGPGEPV